MRKSLALIVTASALALAPAPLMAQEPIKIGHVAALSGASAQSGEALTRGLTIAIDEINAKGGVLGRKLTLIQRDDESSPPKGIVAARELISKENVAAIFGGIDTLLRCSRKKEERERAPHRERESACAAPWDKVYAAVTKSFGETF
jgi:branched-chain amino acid transport system substrate-binding protein